MIFNQNNFHFLTLANKKKKQQQKHGKNSNNQKKTIWNFTSKAILSAFPFLLNAQKKAVYMHISHEINCKINVTSKRTTLLGLNENWAYLVCMLKHHHLMLLSWNLFRSMFISACTKLILVYLAPTILHQY